MTTILVVLVMAGYGTAATTAEFSTVAACEEAAKALMNSSRGYTVVAKCFPKR